MTNSSKQFSVSQCNDNTTTPVFRKQSQSQAVILYLLNRDIWSNSYAELYKLPDLQNAVLPKDIEENSTCKSAVSNPSHNGILEGIVEINPSHVTFCPYVTVELIARFRYANLDLDEFDCESDDVIFKQTIQNIPPEGFDKSDFCHRSSFDLKTYSGPLANLYYKLDSQKEDDFNTPVDKIDTFLLNTNDSGVKYKFPFRFDLNGGPNSVWLKNIDSIRTGQKSRTQFFYECFFDETYADNDFECCDKQPTRQANVQPKDKSNLPKMCDGIVWTVRAFLTPQLSRNKPKAIHIASLKIRKFGYVPQFNLDRYLKPSHGWIDYGLSIAPQSYLDAGHITVVAKLDKLVYGPSEVIRCYVKYNNASVQIIHKFVVEFYQCICFQAFPNKLWRSLISKKRITDLDAKNGMPVLPETPDVLRFCVQFRPWPSKRDMLKSFTHPHVNEIGDIKFDGPLLAFENPNKMEPFETKYLLASSSIHILTQALKRRLPKVDDKRDDFDNEKGINCTCQCISHCLDRVGQYDDNTLICDRCCPKKTNQCDMDNIDVQSIIADLDSNGDNCPVHVYYQVVVKAQFLETHTTNQLGCESVLKQAGLKIDTFMNSCEPKHILSTSSPELSLVCFLNYEYPVKDLIKVPVTEYIH